MHSSLDSPNASPAVSNAPIASALEVNNQRFIGSSSRLVLSSSRLVLLVVFDDVVDRAGRGADAETDQRAFSCPVSGPRADRGAGAGADGGARRGTASSRGDAQQRESGHTRYELSRNHCRDLLARELRAHNF